MKSFSKLTRVASILLAATVVATAAGCSNSNSSSASSEAKKETTELTWWMIGAPQKDNEAGLTELNKYLKDKYNVTIKMNYSNWGDYDSKLTTVIASGTPYDIAFTCSWANNFAQQANAGSYMALNDLIDTNGKDLKDLIPDDVWEAATIDGKIYGVPTYKDSVNGNFYVYPKEFVEGADFDITSVKTLKDNEPYFKWVQENQSTVTPFPQMADGWAGLFDNFDLITPNSFAVIRLDDSSLKVINPYEDPETLETLDTLHDFYNKGYINKDAATAKEYGKFMAFSRQNGWPTAVANWSSSWGYDVVAQPSSDLYMTTATLQGSLNAVSKNSKNGAAAVTLLNAINTDATAKNMLCFGIEGKNYEKTSDTSIKMLNNDYSMPAFAVTSFFSGLYTTDPAPKNSWTDLQEFVNSAAPSPAVGFMFDSSDTKIQTQLAALNTVYNKYKSDLNTGTADPTVTVPKMLDELNKAGLQEFKAEVQKQLDDWKATKK